ncbi:hypothetical protein FOZ60_004675 [Perkinsus olseni]|uniref:Uncharacterized protein n=1 Tax=Perkinsus olseni TaxID=32597 RepID=A0A7J6NT07_PEROL|nr:hypothetical protein FOZ60_004675 [Perkinsus olseni]
MFTPPPPLFNNPFHKLPTTPVHAQSSYYSNAGTPVASPLRHHQQQQPHQHQLASMIGLNTAERVTPDGQQQPHHQQQLASSFLPQRQQPAWFAPLPSLPPVMPLFGGPTPQQVCRSISQPSTTIQYCQWASEAPPGHVVTTRQDAHNAVPQHHLTSAALVPPPAKVILIPEHHTDHSTVSAAALEASHPAHPQAHLASSVPSSSMAVLYPQTARGGGDSPEAITQRGSRAKAASTTPLVDLGLDHHSGSDVMELQLAVHALELENAALRRRAKERSKALAEAQGKAPSSQAAESIAAVDDKIRNMVSSGSRMVPPQSATQGAGEGGDNDESVRVRTLEEEVEGLRRKLAEAERMITSSHAREFDLVSIHDPRPRSSSILVELAQHGVLPPPESSQAVNGAVPRAVSSSRSSDDGDGDNARTSRSSVASPPSSFTFEDALASATATTSIHTAISSPSTWKDRPEVAAPPQRRLSSYRQQREELRPSGQVELARKRLAGMIILIPITMTTASIIQLEMWFWWSSMFSHSKTRAVLFRRMPISLSSSGTSLARPLWDNSLYLAGDGPRLSKVAERAAELRKELMAAQKELEGVSGPYDDYFVQQWKRSVVNQVKAEVDMADIELEKQGQDKDLLEQYTGTSQVDSQLVVAKKFEVKATRSSDTATTATTCGGFLNLLATGAYDGGDGRDASLPKHSVAFRIVSDRITEGHGKVNVPVSGREVPLRKYKLEVSISGKVIKNACVAWDGCEWSPADGVTDEDYCNVNGDGDGSAVELKFDQGIATLEYACVLQTLNKIASVYRVLDQARDTSPQLNTAIALLESLSSGKCQCFPVYYNGTYLARLHIAARHVVHDGPWARRLSDEIRARCACFLACDLRQLIPDDTRCPCTIDGMVDQVKRSTRGIPSDDLTSAERRLLDLVERSF